MTIIRERRTASLRRREFSEGLRKLIRKCSRDGWDDAIDHARQHRYITAVQAVELKAANPNKGVFE